MIPTRVGHAGHGDNRFRGHSVRDELAGRAGFWTLAVLAVGGRMIDGSDAVILDDLEVCLSAADPRIWPMKIVRLAAAYGSVQTGVCAALLAMESAAIGPSNLRRVAEFLTRLQASVPEDCSDDTFETLLGAHLTERIPGFGVPFRPRDERVLALQGCLARRGRAEGSYWRLAHRVEKVLLTRHRAPLNIVGACGAVLLDLAISPQQIGSLPLMVTNHLANAFEGASQRSPALQCLPPDSILFVGTPARRSARAINTGET